MPCHALPTITLNHIAMLCFTPINNADILKASHMFDLDPLYALTWTLYGQITVIDIILSIIVCRPCQIIKNMKYFLGKYYNMQASSREFHNPPGCSSMGMHLQYKSDFFLLSTFVSSVCICGSSMISSQIAINLSSITIWTLLDLSVSLCAELKKKPWCDYSLQSLIEPHIGNNTLQLSFMLRILLR